MDSSSSSEAQDPVLALILNNLTAFRQHCTDANLIDEYYNKGFPSYSVELLPTGSSSSSNGNGISLTIELENSVRSFTRPNDPLPDEFEFHFYEQTGVSNLSAQKTPGQDSVTVSATIDPSHQGPASFQINIASPTRSTLRRRYTIHGNGLYRDSARIGLKRVNEKPRLKPNYINYLVGWLNEFWELNDQGQDHLIPKFYPPTPGPEFDPFEHAREKLIRDGEPQTQAAAPQVLALDHIQKPAEKIGIDGRNFLGINPEAWGCMMQPSLSREDYFVQELSAAMQRNSVVTFTVAFDAGSNYTGYRVESVNQFEGTVTIRENAFFPGDPITLNFDDIYTISGPGVQDWERLYKTLPREPSWWRSTNGARFLGFDRFPPDSSFDCRSFSAAAVRYLRSQLASVCPNAKVSRMNVPAHAIVYVDLGGCQQGQECDSQCCTGNFVYEPQSGETWDGGPTFQDDALLYAALNSPDKPFDPAYYEIAKNPDDSDFDIGVNRIDWDEDPEEVSRIRRVICDCLFRTEYISAPGSNENKMKQRCRDGTFEDWFKNNFAPGPGKITLDDPDFARPLSCEKYQCSDGGCSPETHGVFGSQMNQDECESYCAEYFGCGTTPSDPTRLTCTGEWSTSPFFTHTHFTLQDCLNGGACQDKIKSFRFDDAPAPGNADHWFAPRLGEATQMKQPQTGT